MKIKSPTLLLDQLKCRKNIQSMTEKANQLGIDFRPHFKTHQSHEIGNWFREYGITKITVSSLKMADFFSRDGWNDITVAFPVNILEIDLINKLAAKIQLNLVLESVNSASFLIDNLLAQVDYFIKIDPAYGRTGISHSNHETIQKLINISNDSYALNFKGFLSHFGNTYNAQSKKEVQEIFRESISHLDALKSTFQKKYPNLILSIGDTPSCSLSEEFGSADELRPGNFVFYDLMQLQIGSCTQNEIATAMACPIVALHENRNEMIIHGGSIHFASDFITMEDKTLYGIPVHTSKNGWGELIAGAYLSKLSQEHGTIYMPAEHFQNFDVGDIIKILPVHSCTNSNLMKSYFTLEGVQIDHMESGNWLR